MTSRGGIKMAGSRMVKTTAKAGRANITGSEKAKSRSLY
jgi:hypothetical protein